eukprot:3593536-Rhodomonas_salina.1
MEAKLQAIGQEHVLQGLTDAQKPALFAQACSTPRLLFGSKRVLTVIPGGLEQYVATAKELLKNSFDGKTAFEGFKPSVPIGDKLPVSAVIDCVRSSKYRTEYLTSASAKSNACTACIAVRTHKHCRDCADVDGWQLASKEFAEMEALGMSVISKAAFVLVAGGLGERLGYNGIKVSLP